MGLRQNLKFSAPSDIEVKFSDRMLWCDSMLKVGDTAPDFDLPDASMEMVRLADLRGKHNVVLYFYPKDDTLACTMESINFGDLEPEFERHHTIVYGVSRDDCICHAIFRDKHGLTVQLLSDEDGEVCQSYNVLEEREKNGVKKLCVHRCTIVIDREGIVRHIIRNINPKGHAREVLQLIKETI
jgi:thioredoxin-dependent peroxiredoxin